MLVQYPDSSGLGYADLPPIRRHRQCIKELTVLTRRGTGMSSRVEKYSLAAALCDRSRREM